VNPTIVYTLEPKTKFKRDLKRARRRNWDLSLLAKATDLLLATGKLSADYKPHPLKGKYEGCIDAHIKSDWVFIYEVDEEEKVVILHRTGTHQDVFVNY